MSLSPSVQGLECLCKSEILGEAKAMIPRAKHRFSSSMIGGYLFLVCMELTR